jgi:hypothetical protein
MRFLLSPLPISDFANLGLFPPHFSQIFLGLVNLASFFKEQTFCVLDFSIAFFVSISLILALIYIISLLLLVLDFALSWFSRNLRCSIRSFICDPSVLLIYAIMAINFPLRTAFTVSHRFW